MRFVAHGEVFKRQRAFFLIFNRLRDIRARRRWKNWNEVDPRFGEKWNDQNTRSGWIWNEIFQIWTEMNWNLPDSPNEMKYSRSGAKWSEKHQIWVDLDWNELKYQMWKEMKWILSDLERNETKSHIWSEMNWTSLPDLHLLVSPTL